MAAQKRYSDAQFSTFYRALDEGETTRAAAARVDMNFGYAQRLATRYRKKQASMKPSRDIATLLHELITEVKGLRADLAAMPRPAPLPAPQPPRLLERDTDDAVERYPVYTSDDDMQEAEDWVNQEWY